MRRRSRAASQNRSLEAVRAPHVHLGDIFGRAVTDIWSEAAVAAACSRRLVASFFCSVPLESQRVWCAFQAADQFREIGKQGRRPRFGERLICPLFFSSVFLLSFCPPFCMHFCPSVTSCCCCDPRSATRIVGMDPASSGFRTTRMVGPMSNVQ